MELVEFMKTPKFAHHLENYVAAIYAYRSALEKGQFDRITVHLISIETEKEALETLADENLHSHAKEQLGNHVAGLFNLFISPEFRIKPQD